ncbi:hypothetical protein ACM66B_005238 [Microbotryomycetes sp. NB124-2]
MAQVKVLILTDTSDGEDDATTTRHELGDSDMSDLPDLARRPSQLQYTSTSLPQQHTTNRNSQLMNTQTPRQNGTSSVKRQLQAGNAGRAQDPRPTHRAQPVASTSRLPHTPSNITPRHEAGPEVITIIDTSDDEDQLALTNPFSARARHTTPEQRSIVAGTDLRFKKVTSPERRAPNSPPKLSMRAAQTDSKSKKPQSIVLDDDGQDEEDLPTLDQLTSAIRAKSSGSSPHKNGGTKSSPDRNGLLPAAKSSSPAETPKPSEKQVQVVTLSSSPVAKAENQVSTSAVKRKLAKAIELQPVGRKSPVHKVRPAPEADIVLSSSSNASPVALTFKSTAVDSSLPAPPLPQLETARAIDVFPEPGPSGDPTKSPKRPAAAFVSSRRPQPESSGKHRLARPAPIQKDNHLPGGAPSLLEPYSVETDEPSKFAPIADTSQHGRPEPPADEPPSNDAARAIIEPMSIDEVPELPKEGRVPSSSRAQAHSQSPFESSDDTRRRDSPRSAAPPTAHAVPKRLTARKSTWTPPNQAPKRMLKARKSTQVPPHSNMALSSSSDTTSSGNESSDLDGDSLDGNVRKNDVVVPSSQKKTDIVEMQVEQSIEQDEMDGSDEVVKLAEDTSEIKLAPSSSQFSMQLDETVIEEPVKLRVKARKSMYQPVLSSVDSESTTEYESSFADDDDSEEEDSVDKSQDEGGHLRADQDDGAGQIAKDEAIAPETERVEASGVDAVVDSQQRIEDQSTSDSQEDDFVAAGLLQANRALAAAVNNKALTRGPFRDKKYESVRVGKSDELVKRKRSLRQRQNEEARQAKELAWKEPRQSSRNRTRPTTYAERALWAAAAEYGISTVTTDGKAAAVALTAQVELPEAASAKVLAQAQEAALWAQIEIVRELASLQVEKDDDEAGRQIKQIKREERRKRAHERKLTGPAFENEFQDTQEILDHMRVSQRKFERFNQGQEFSHPSHHYTYEQMINDALSNEVSPTDEHGNDVEPPHIRVVPLEDGRPPFSPPFEFIYTNRIVYAPGVVPQQSPGCDCQGDCGSKLNSPTCACRIRQQFASKRKPVQDHAKRSNRSNFAYTSDGRIRRSVLNTREPIWECNSMCGCGPGCVNRVVGRVPRYSIDIFRTEDRGWAVRNPPSHSYELWDGEWREHEGIVIPQGSPLGIYAGELLSSNDGTGREEQLYAFLKRNYIFGLDSWHISEDIAYLDYIRNSGCDERRKFAAFDSEGHLAEKEDPQWSVDAFFYGSWTRFCNHRCSTWNVSVVPVYVDEGSISRPLNILVAAQDIYPGEEIAITYAGTRPDLMPGQTLAQYQSESLQRRAKCDPTWSCYCGDDLCHGIMFKLKEDDSDDEEVESDEQHGVIDS